VDLEALELHSDLPNRAALAAVELAAIAFFAVVVVTRAAATTGVAVTIPLTIAIAIAIAIAVVAATVGHATVVATIGLSAVAFTAIGLSGVVTAVGHATILLGGRLAVFEIGVEPFAIARAVPTAIVPGLDPNSDDRAVPGSERAVVTVEPIELLMLAILVLDDDVREIFARHHMNFVAFEVHGDVPDRTTLRAVQYAAVPALPVIAIAVRGRLAAVVALALDRGARLQFERVAGKGAVTGGTAQRQAEQRKQESFGSRHGGQFRLSLNS
jgi:hypothetical protein